jgi:hypothetical protein
MDSKKCTQVYLVERLATTHDDIWPEVQDVYWFFKLAVENVHGLGRHQHIAGVVRKSKL